MRNKLFFALLIILAASFYSHFEAEAQPLPAIFDIEVICEVTDSYDYEYALYYSDYDNRYYKMRDISHWWLEINCGHSSIDPNSIYGYSEIEGEQVDWVFEFDDNLAQVGGYTDWVIKWEAEDENGDSIEPPKGAGDFIGYFGFHSTQPPVDGYFGGKGGLLFTSDTTCVPMSTHGNNNIPEPVSISILGILLAGLPIFKRKGKNA
jgi:hypothetical protein